MGGGTREQCGSNKAFTGSIFWAWSETRGGGVGGVGQGGGQGGVDGGGTREQCGATRRSPLET